MRRRRFLALAGAGLAGGAGCLQFGYAGDGTTTDRVDSVAGRSLPLPESALDRAAKRDAIPAITGPAFGPDWSGVALEAPTEFGVREIEPRLADFDRVVGVVRGGRARAYPLRVLGWHEVVNDVFPADRAAAGGDDRQRTDADDRTDPLVVTYCPLCGSAIVAERRVEDRTLTFDVSGLLWRDNLVLVDFETGSLWGQVVATALRGPLTGTELSLVPSTLTTWGAWRDQHPDTDVLLPPPESGTTVGRGWATARNYNLDPYAAYEPTDRVGYSDRDFEDQRLHPKARVLGVARGDDARAYPVAAVREAGVVQDTVGDLPVVVAAAPGEAVVAYDRRVDGRTRAFAAAGPRHLRAAGSRWLRSSGEAVDGPHEGRRLRPATDRSTLFWFAWLDAHPDSTVYGADGSRSAPD